MKRLKQFVKGGTPTLLDAEQAEIVRAVVDALHLVKIKDKRDNAIVGTGELTDNELVITIDFDAVLSKRMERLGVCVGGTAGSRNFVVAR